MADPLDPSKLRGHSRCGCPEQYKGRDCPACRGTGLIPPVARDEYEELLRRLAAARAALNRVADLTRGAPGAGQGATLELIERIARATEAQP